MELVTDCQRDERLSSSDMKNLFEGTMKRCIWTIRICLKGTGPCGTPYFVCGGGVCISPSGYILSVASIFTPRPSDIDKIYGRIVDGKECPLTLVKIDPDSNLALLSVKSEETNYDFTSVSQYEACNLLPVATVICYDNRYLCVGYVSCPEKRFHHITYEMMQWSKRYPRSIIPRPCLNKDTKLMQIYGFPRGEEMWGGSVHGFPVLENTGKVIGLISAQGLDFVYGIRLSDSLNKFLEGTPVLLVGGSKTTGESSSSSSKRS